MTSKRCRDSDLRLLAALCDGTITPQEHARLEQRLIADRSLRQAYFDYLSLHLHLRERQRRSQLPEEDPLRRRLQAMVALPDRPQRRRRLAWTVVAAAVALVLLVPAGVWLCGRRNTEVGPHSAPSPAAQVATVDGMESVQYPPGQSPLAIGQPLSPGSLEIVGGFLGVQFASGANAILEGPARLEILGRNAACLRRGKVAVHVPEAAKGFILESPEGRILDLGTRFGVAVADRGETEVHVLQGLVRATVRGQSTDRELRPSQGLRMVDGDAVAIEAAPDRFLTALPPPQAYPLDHIHWSFDEGQGQVVHDSGVRLGGVNGAATLTSLTPDGPIPAWIAGRFGMALQFDGKGGYAVSSFRGIAGSKARTIAFWVRVPRDWTPQTGGYALVSWGINQPGQVWQISVNPAQEDGPIGRLRVGVGGGAGVVGDRDLRDGHWHHAAVVLYEGEQVPDTTQILLYVDGDIEPAYRRVVQKVQTNVANPKASSVQLGCGFSGLGRVPSAFRGALDEVFIVDAALRQETIQKLMHENTLAGNGTAGPSGRGDVE